jgi:lipocalin
MKYNILTGRIAAATLGLGLVATLVACNANPPANAPPTVASVDVARYLGTWVQQGMVPNKF